MAAYTKTVWNSGDVISAAKLNNLETQYDDMFTQLSAYLAANNITSIHTTGLGQFDGGVTVNGVNIVDSSGYLGSSKNVGCSAFLGTNQTIPSNVSTPVAFDSEIFDPNNCFNTGTHLFTAPKNGYYLVNASIGYPASGVFTVFLCLKLSGTIIQNVGGQTNSNIWTTMTATRIVYMNAGQTIEVDAQHFSSNPVNIFSGSSNNPVTYLEVMLLDKN